MVLANTALAHGAYGGHAFGLVFLNFVGNVLFLLMIFWLIKAFVYAVRSDSMRKGSSSKWKSRKEAWNARYNEEQSTEAGQSSIKHDSAMTTARQRLADGEINPEEFEVIKQGLTSNQGSSTNNANDSAIDTARMRFAKSEITADEYEAVKKALLDTSQQS